MHKRDIHAVGGIRTCNPSRREAQTHAFDGAATRIGQKNHKQNKRKEVEERETNLMSLALLFLCLMLNMFRMLMHPSSGVCDLFVELFHGLYCSGSMCVGVKLWVGCGGVVSVCRLHTTTPPQPTHNVTPTNIEPEQYNP